MRRISVAALAVLLGGCVSQSMVLQNDRGQTYQCQHEGWGYIGAPMAASRQKECIKKAEAAGYHKVTDPIQAPAKTVESPAK